ncbi:MAG: HAD family hydrolase [Alphaproteobacteria bacterium]|nr:HAD family hydrolase [Alphaproteobacteria bacterium]
MIRAILFDVGGPLEDTAGLDDRADALVVDLFRRETVHIQPADYLAAESATLESRAPDFWRGVIWQLAVRSPALAHSVWTRFAQTRGADSKGAARAGMIELIASLRVGDIGLVALDDAPRDLGARIDALGYGALFDAVVSGAALDTAKPDPRLLRSAAEACGAQPAECLVVGDRIDADIAPARRLGMTTIWLRVGRWRDVEPRDWTELPDAEVRDADELAVAIDRLVSR